MRTRIAALAATAIPTLSACFGGSDDDCDTDSMAGTAVTQVLDGKPKPKSTSKKAKSKKKTTKKPAGHVDTDDCDED